MIARVCSRGSPKSRASSRAPPCAVSRPQSERDGPSLIRRTGSTRLRASRYGGQATAGNCTFRPATAYAMRDPLRQARRRPEASGAVAGHGVRRVARDGSSNPSWSVSLGSARGVPQLAPLACEWAVQLTARYLSRPADFFAVSRAMDAGTALTSRACSRAARGG